MAEFQEIMRQKRRMCERNECHVCPLGKVVFCGRYDIDPKCAEQAETIITKWASEHPEPVYPTWDEWQKENFPDARFPLSLCHFTKGDCPIPEDPSVGACATCRKQPIPADIAKKLGIKPKGGSRP